MSEQAEDDGRRECTAADPWDPSKSKRAFHPDSVEVHECDEFKHYKCPYCKQSFKVTLPSH